MGSEFLHASPIHPEKWHTIIMPFELWEILKAAKVNSKSEFVASNTDGGMLSYHTYHKALKLYCREAGVQELASHGLRHSTSELYMHLGASRDDLRILFSHSTSAVTDRYIHDKGESLAGVADVIRLFPEQFPKSFPNRKTWDKFE
jgi:integrase